MSEYRVYIQGEADKVCLIVACDENDAITAVAELYDLEPETLEAIET